MDSERIAIVGIGLRYPDADSTGEFWENVLAGRRAFRTLPDARMNLADYYSPDPQAPDRFYTRNAAVLRDFAFDRVAYRVAGSTFRATDMTHWLALDTAARALADAGFPAGDGLAREATGVVVGNSLTGEFSRANLMRLRWPYVRRTVAAAATRRGWDTEETAAFLRDLEAQYKAPFPEIDEDTLAGGLANTIAGRICNHFDFAGGGYTVDGACSSSLLSVATAANALAHGDLDVAVAGGVDLSIDPFEVIGFAKTGALATDEMKVYDAGSNGFWPGEGCGMLVLLREADAVARGARIYATITGWGISSDGKGAITRPEAAGHRLALRRAYRRAGYGVETVSYFEGHGTGTAVGDATEIRALSDARREADPSLEPAALSTVKGNIGHTKAAAGVAGLIKAALAVFHQVIPPGTGHHTPHPALRDESARMYVPARARLWPPRARVRAGVSAMGFGGINSHVTLEQAPGVARRDALDPRVRSLVAGRQDAELLLLDADDVAGLRARVTELLALVGQLSFAELADLAATLARGCAGRAVRAAVVAADPTAARRRLERLDTMLDTMLDTVPDAGPGAGPTDGLATADGVFLGARSASPRIGYVFPGQGSGRGGLGALSRRFPVVDELAAGLVQDGDQVATDVAQPRIVTGSLAGLRVLRELGVDAAAAAGHSLGELTALHWSGALDERGLRALAGRRGAVMAAAGDGDGAMASVAASPSGVETFLVGEPDVVIAGYNAPGQTVVSGPADAVDRVCAAATAAGVTATRLAVSHAFHSPAMARAAQQLAEHLAGQRFARPERPVISTVTGDVLHAGQDLAGLLRDQVVLPVRFREAAAAVAARSDLVVEVGPGRVLSGLVEQIAPDVPVLALDTENESLSGLLAVVGAAFALGARVNTEALFAGRAVRTLPLTAPDFLTSPCETVPALDTGLAADPGLDLRLDAKLDPDSHPLAEAASGADSTLDLLCRVAAERAELPLSELTADTHPLDDLHLSSITVGQLVNEVARVLGRPALQGMPNFATVCLGELADMIDELDGTAQQGDTEQPGEVAGVDTWVRPLEVCFEPTPPLAAVQGDPAAAAGWELFATDGHPVAGPLRDALAGAGLGDGVLLCLPPDCDSGQAGLMLRAGRAALAGQSGTRFVVVQHGFGAAGLARTLYLEDPSVRTTVVDLAVAGGDADGDAVTAVVAEVAATTGFSEVRYTADGTRTVPRLRPLPATEGEPVLGAADVLLVTGGGKGITAESALALARDSGAALGLLGRADPATDEELAANLERMSAAGLRHRYVRADVVDPAQVRAAVAEVTGEFGPVTAILHGAGRNEPAALFSLTEEPFVATLAPKVDGLRAVLDAVDADRIRLLVSFGSIIGRAGLRGEAHYATANDWLTEATLRFGAEHPRARVVALEWSVWSGAGMGEKLGVVGALLRDGITPIPAAEGIDILRRVIADPAAPSVVVVCGRTAGLPTLPAPRGELPLARFVDRVLVHYPGIELVTEADLSDGSDPYLSDHLLDGDLLFPAVLGMEAMTQVAAAVAGEQDTVPVLEDVAFLRPIVVAPGGSTTIRIAALVRDPRTVDVVVRAGDTGYAADHFRARLRFPRPELTGEPAPPPTGLANVPVDPVADLYGSLLFQGKRFQRLLAYRRVAARHAVAEVGTAAGAAWFAAFLPQDRILADPGTRDTMMHAIQCCVPDATLLPQGIERLDLARPADQEVPYVVLDARERDQDGDTYVYDLDVRDPDGRVVERWRGLSLRAVRWSDGTGPWAPAMLGPYLERGCERVLGGSRAVVVEPDPAGVEVAGVDARRAQTALALSRAAGEPVRPRYRPDGRPEADGCAVSAAHGAGLTLVVAGDGGLACDLEEVLARSGRDWADLLGPEPHAVGALLADELGEPVDVANTRVWTALECVRKTGAMTQALAAHRAGDGDGETGWVVLANGSARIASWVGTVDGRESPVAIAVLREQE